jgi:hypothetical protein
MTNLIIDINKMFDNEDSDFDQNLNQDLNQNLNLDSDLNLEILNLLSQIPNQDLYLTPNQDNKNPNSSKE